MDMDSYQSATRKTATYPYAFTGNEAAINYCIMGLAGEVGEICNKWKKILRGDFNDEVFGVIPRGVLRDLFFKEMGDVQWYLARACEELNFDLDVVAEANLNHLASRAERGVIRGNGDDR